MKPKPRLFSRVLAFFMAFALLLTALPQSVFAMEPSDIENAIPLTLDEPVTFTDEDGKLVLSFTPEESRDYVLYLQDADNCEPYVEWFDADLNRMRGWNLSQEPAFLYLQAGTAIYYEITNLQDTADFSATVCLTMPSYITFDANGGYFGDNTDDSFRYFTTDENKYLTDEIPENVNHADSHKRFVGWAESPDAEAPLDNYYESIRYRPYTEDAVFYAVWAESIPVTYHANNPNILLYDDNNDLVSEAVKLYPPGTRISIGNLPFSYYKPEESLWHLKGLSTDPLAEDADYSTVTLTEPLDLYCLWYEGVDLKFDANGGYFWDDPIATSVSSTFLLGESFNISSHWADDITGPDADMALAGWSWTADGSEPVTEITITEDLNKKTLYAIWTHGIPVTFHANHAQASLLDNGKLVESLVKYYAPGTILHTYESPFSFKTEDGSFLYYDGFSLNPDTEQNEYRDLTITEPVDLYCIWYEGAMLHLNANGGSFTFNPGMETHNTIYRLGTTYDMVSNWQYEITHPDSSMTLAGWSWSADGSDPFTELTVTADMEGKTIYAVWTAGIFVTFHSANENVHFRDKQGNFVDTIQVAFTEGSMFDPSRTYYDYNHREDGDTFGWYLNSYSWDVAGHNWIAEPFEITGPIDLYCQFYDGIEIKMNGNGGLFWGEDETVNYVFRIGQTQDFENGFYPNLMAPEPDLVLTGWSWKQDGSEPVTHLPITTEHDGKTLYAIWSTGIKVTLHANLEGAYFTDDTGNQVSDLTITVKAGATVDDVRWRYLVVSPDNNKWRDSYSRSASPDGAALADDTVLTDGMDLYVIWRKTIPLILDAGDGTYGGQPTYQTTVTVGSGSYFAPDWYSAKPNQENMAFLGWSLTTSKEDIVRGRIYPKETDESITLHAIYAPGHPLTIISNNPAYGKFGVFENGASYDYSNPDAEASFLYAQGKELNFLGVDIIRSEGCIFLGWSKTIDGEILDWSYVPDGDDTLYGIFAEGFEVYFAANGGTFDETLETTVSYWLEEVPKGSAIGEVSVWHPSKHLIGWNTKPDGSGEMIDPATYIPTESMDLYAIWGDGGSVPVTGVSFANASVTIKVEETKSCPATVAPANATNKKVTYKSSDESIVTVDANGKITGKKTGKATITATTADGGKMAAMKVEVLFKDVADSSKYWYAPVYWAADKGITNGYQSASYIGTDKFGTFGAEENCTREQMITFLYREAGSPAVSSADIAKYNTFSDVKTSANPYYLKPVVWAAKNGITKGYSSGPNKGKFGVGLTVTREDTVTFIYRMAKKYQKNFLDVTAADLENKSYSFTDVASGKYYQNPIVWAAKNGITKGYSSGVNKGKFGVGFNVLRKDIVTFLYRYDNL